MNYFNLTSFNQNNHFKKKLCKAVIVMVHCILEFWFILQSNKTVDYYCTCSLKNHQKRLMLILISGTWSPLWVFVYMYAKITEQTKVYFCGIIQSKLFVTVIQYATQVDLGPNYMYMYIH